MTKEEFCERFKGRMLKCAGSMKFEDGTSIVSYAEQVAPTYWDDPQRREEGPEACADTDMEYWEE